MDSILRNHTESYVGLFLKNLVENFAIVYRVSKLDERLDMYRIRMQWTWSWIEESKMPYGMFRGRKNFFWGSDIYL